MHGVASPCTVHRVPTALSAWRESPPIDSKTAVAVVAVAVVAVAGDGGIEMWRGWRDVEMEGGRGVGEAR